MNKSPAFQFYPAEFIADENVVLMTNQEVGCYIKLMCYCWREGSIPKDVPKIAKLCGEDGSAMADLWRAISPCFAQSVADPSRLMHPRLEAERQKQEEYKKERSHSGAKGAKVRWEKAQIGLAPDGSANGSAIAQPMAQPMANDGSLSSSSSSSSSNTDKHIPPKPPQENKPPEFGETSIQFHLSCLLRQHIVGNNPKAKVPRETISDMAKWSETFDKLIRLDKRTPEEIESLIVWCQRDRFWKTNILSPGTLREKWDRLWLQSQERRNEVQRLASKSTSIFDEMRQQVERGEDIL